MGRILRMTIIEDTPQGIDLGIVGPGKLFLQNDGNFDIILGYDASDVALGTRVNYFTIAPGVTYVFDVSQFVGFLEQNQLMYFTSLGGNGTLVIWVADNQ